MQEKTKKSPNSIFLLLLTLWSENKKITYLTKCQGCLFFFFFSTRINLSWRKRVWFKLIKYTSEKDTCCNVCINTHAFKHRYCHSTDNNWSYFSYSEPNILSLFPWWNLIICTVPGHKNLINDPSAMKVSSKTCLFIDSLQIFILL